MPSRETLFFAFRSFEPTREVNPMCKLPMKIWALGNSLDVQDTFTGLCKGTHCYYSLLHCWDQGVQPDRTINLYEAKGSGWCKALEKVLFSSWLPPSKTKYCRGTAFQRILSGSAFQKNYRRGSWSWRWNLYRETGLLVDHYFLWRGYWDILDVLETSRMKLMSPNCKCLLCWLLD